MLLFCIVEIGSWYFTAFARTFYVCFYQDQDRWWIQWTQYLDQLCRSGKKPETRRKPTSIGDYCTFNGQLYGRTFLVRPYSCARIVAVEAAVSNSFVPWNWKKETTYRETRSRRNLTSGRDLEGELIHRGSIFVLRRSGRLRHRSSSTTTASPPSPSIPSTSHIHLVVIPVLVVDLYKDYSFMISSIIFAMMFIAFMSE